MNRYFAAIAAVLISGGSAWANGPLAVSYDPASRRIVVHDAAGALLDGGVVEVCRDGQVLASTAQPVVHSESVDGSVRLTLKDHQQVVLATQDDRVTIQCDGGGAIRCVFHNAVKGDTIAGFSRDQQAADHDVLVTTLGPAPVPGSRSIFNIGRDLLVSANAASVEWTHAEAGWQLQASDPKAVNVQITPDYYRDTLGIAYYAPIEKRSYWRTAPMVCMTWYGVCGEKRPQNLAVLKPEIDWAATHLLPYAGRLVFQLDDNYPYRDDAAMRGLSDYLRSKGLIPGVWLTPFSMLAPKEAKELSAEHPDWFLRDGSGKLLTSFAGMNWGWTGYNVEKRWPRARSFSYTVNANNKEAVKAVLEPSWQRVSETWNYDFFKIDAQPNGVIPAYRAAINGGGIAGYRHGLEVGRQVVGPDKFINACAGEPTVPIEAIGKVNGSRTGPDTGGWGHAGRVVVGGNYLNNIVWWSDPDAAAELWNKPLANARLNAAMRVLTGQQFLTDDFWTKVPQATTRVWQQSLPTLDIHPANLFWIDDKRMNYDVFDLRIAKPWGTYDVAGLFNYNRAPASKVLDLSRLPLASDHVYVYEFFSQAYLGEFDRHAKISRKLDGIDAQVFAIVPAKADRPQLLSTSRHMTQGGLDLVSFDVRLNGDRCTISGESDHLVTGDPYTLVFHTGRWHVENAPSGAKVATDGEITRMTWTPSKPGRSAWSIVFAK